MSDNKNDILHVEGGKPLNGTIKVRGAKNFVSKAMVAALLAPGTSVLKNVPEIRDVHVVSDLLRLHGVDVTVVPVEDSGGPLTVQALLDGDVQLADIYTADPTIAENDLVVLEDPESMILPQNVVPVASSSLDETAVAAIEGVIAELSADDLVELNRQSVVDQAGSADIASGWLTEKGLV